VLRQTVADGEVQGDLCGTGARTRRREGIWVAEVANLSDAGRSGCFDITARDWISECIAWTMEEI
jgi:hypothetical protein